MKKSRSDKLIIITAIMIFFAFTFLAIFTINQERKHIDATFESELLSIGKLIALDEELIQKLVDEQFGLSDIIDVFYVVDPQVSHITILDMNGLICYHPDNDLVGETYVGGTVNDALEGQTYVKEQSNEDGDLLLAFVPIYDNDVQVGVASVGVLVSDVDSVKLDKARTILLGFGLGLCFSLVGLAIIRHRFKSDLFGFDPSEIAILYAENKSIIDQLNEGVISIDKNYKITTINEALQKMFNIPQSAIGENVNDVFPNVDFKCIIDNNHQVINKYKKINEQKLLMNAFPLYLEYEIIGATAIFRSHLEVDSLVDQIKGYRQIAEALRSQKHEFQNKLHVVLGLIKMKDYSKAENYIMENVYTTNLASDYYSSRIKDDRILALFIGKEIQTKEFSASLLLTSDSYLTKKHNPINSDDIVIVLGNLIDNSFEAYANKDLDDKKIVVDIFEDEEKIKITVIDQAGGIKEDIIGHIFERGVSSKNGDSRGTGLSLVNEIVNLYQGEKIVSSTKQETKIEIILTKVIS